MWAFSEAALGGILHALKIPFTGLIIGGSAVIFITLIAYFSGSKKILLESTIKVILVKFVVSPYSPINAYFAVMLQFVLGYILFYGGFNRISAILLGFFSLLFSAFQKIIILTLVFGMTLWESIDIFFDFIMNKILPASLNLNDTSFSYLIIGTYITLHIIGGVIAGWYASILPSRLAMHNSEKIESMNENVNDFLNSDTKGKRKRKWWLKPSGIILFLFLIFVIIISFLFDEVDSSIATKIAIMFARSIVIIIVWYYFISPLLLKFVNKVLLTKKQKRAEEIENIVQVFPNIKSIIKYSWNKTQNYKGLKRIIIFIDSVFINYLLFERNDHVS
ncbi:MAG: hypothetical protein OQJ81_06235 [Melioribacteraceae bacterium]|nr:hypothetical protein [Melioribacteraceae bacterium]